MQSTAAELRSIRNTLRLILGAILLLIACLHRDLSHTPFFDAVTVICVLAAGLIFLSAALRLILGFYTKLADSTNPAPSNPKSGE